MSAFRGIMLPLLAMLTLAGASFSTEDVRIPGSLDFGRQNAALTVTNAPLGGTVIQLTQPEVLIMDTLLNFESQQAFAMAGEELYYVDGAPTVPQISRLYRIPNTGSVDLNVLAADFTVLADVNPMAMDTRGEGFASLSHQDPGIYGADAWYPAQPVIVSEPMIFRDFRVVRVTLFPVQVNPVRHEARLYTNLNAELVPNNTPGESELLNPRRPSGNFASMYRNMIVNLDESELDDITVNPGSYLILCKDHATVNGWADSLATLKKRLGYDVVIDRRTSWSAGQMATAVQQAYAAFDPPLEFVCIIGDPEDQSTFGMPTGGGNYDHPFAAVAGGDHIEDVGIGRISGRNAGQFATAWAKIRSYESDPYMADTGWFRRAFLYAGVSGGFSSNRILMAWARQEFYTATEKDTVYFATHQGPVNPTLIAQRFNEGIAFFLWRGTVVGEMNSNSPNGTNNGFKLPLCLAITCGSGDFDNDEGLNESWFFAGTSSNPKGAVCGIGTATWGTHVQYNNTVAGGLVYNICNLAVEHIGNALAGAKAQLVTSFPSDSYALNFIYWNNLIGEPALSMWTRTPTVMNVSYPQTVNVGSRRVRPQVTDATTGEPISDALVVLWKGNETYSRMLTDAGGFIDVPVTVNTPGNMTLTVSKRNHKPVFADIQCVSAAQMVSLASFSLDDDNAGGTSGNADGMLNPGELIDLAIYLRNFGTSAIGTDVSAVLTSADPNVNIVSSTQGYANIAPGDSAISTPFRVQVAPLLIDAHRLLFTLQVTASGQVTYSSFVIEGEAGIAIFNSKTISGGDGDGLLEPNETVNLSLTIRNVGDLVMNNTTGTLRSNSSFVSVFTSTASFGNIAVNQNATSASPFVVRAHPLAYPGHIARFQLFLNSNNGHQDTVVFSFTVGSIAPADPTGPDAYGYYAYENNDEDVNGEPYEPVRAFAYVDVSASGTNLDINDQGVQDGSSPIYSRLRDLPFDFTFYGETYDQITICSNGWAAFGSQADQDHFRNYPIPGQQSPEAMLAVFWDDLKTSSTNQGEYVYYDQPNHRFIIQWKAQNAFGTAPLDFEIILLDPAFYPTRDGNGIIIYQYQQVYETQSQHNDIPYSTIGIQAPGNVVGLQYRWNNSPAAGAQSLAPGRCIVFTTEARTAFGTITGTVLDAESSQPLPGAVVTLDGENYSDTTDVSGAYTLSNVLIGTYTVRGSKFGYNDATRDNIVVELDSTETVSFSMSHPEVELSTDAIYVTLPGDPVEATFDMINNGNGPLDYSIAVEFVAGGNHIDPWDSVTGIPISQSANDLIVQGVEFVGDYWWVTGGQNGKQFYRYDLEGDYVGSLPQPGQGATGWFDMAYDGTYIYGSGDENIYGVDQNGVIRDTIAGPCNPNGSLAYDPATDHFWVTDRQVDLYEMNRQGQILTRFPSGLDITGLAWHGGDLDGFFLYAFAQDPAHGNAGVWKIHPVTGARMFVAALGNGATERAAGCTITSGWNSTLVVFGAILSSPQVDRLVVHDVAFNTSWISVTPAISQIPANQRMEISVDFSPAGLRPYIYNVNLRINTNSADTLLILPVTLEITEDVPDSDPRTLPLAYVLEQNFPNPFNSTTNFRFALREPGFTTLKVYNLLGELVAAPLAASLPAGVHTLSYDMNGLATGQYFYVLESGSFRQARKMLLLK
ncbi:carboxypeptidase regulatory-like domain-containing protein [candidate division KSB1 bacterium]|nr:carboxypeptidase regulatory-like domain-containing protein [candidate division KSB1 bacterium]